MLYTYLYHFSLHGKGSGSVAVIPNFSATIAALSSSVIDIFSSASASSLSLIGSIFLMPVSQSSMIDPSTNLNIFKFIWLSSLNTLSSTS